MSETLEHIKEEVKSLRPAERFDLWNDLGKEFIPSSADDQEEATAEAAWDAELDARVREVEDGQLELVSAEDAVMRIRSNLATRRTGRMPTE